MLTLNDELLKWIVHFALIFLRIAALFIISPIFGGKNLTTFTKIILSVLISYILVPTIPQDSAVALPTTNLIIFTLSAAREILIGLTMGYITVLFFSAVQFAGQIIDVQIGISISSVFDPATQAQVPLTGSILNTVLLLTFLAVDGHLALIRLFADSYKLIPLGGTIFSTDIPLYMVQLFSSLLILGVKIALPVIAAGIVVEICLGMIVRSMPQINVFVVGIPLKIFLGLVVLYLMIPLYMSATGQIFDSALTGIENLFAYFT